MTDMPVHLADQESAAMRQRDTQMANAGMNVAHDATHETKALIDLCMDKWEAAGKRVCVHVAGSGPRPVYMVLGHPSAVMCDQCFADAVNEMGGTDEDLTCDVCRKVFADGLYNVGLANKFLTIVGGVCDDCRLILLGS